MVKVGIQTQACVNWKREPGITALDSIFWSAPEPCVLLSKPLPSSLHLTVALLQLRLTSAVTIGSKVLLRVLWKPSVAWLMFIAASQTQILNQHTRLWELLSRHSYQMLEHMHLPFWFLYLECWFYTGGPWSTSMFRIAPNITQLVNGRQGVSIQAWMSPELAHTLRFPAIHGLDDYLAEGYYKFFIEITHHHLKNHAWSWGDYLTPQTGLSAYILLSGTSRTISPSPEPEPRVVLHCPSLTPGLSTVPTTK